MATHGGITMHGRCVGKFGQRQSLRCRVSIPFEGPRWTAGPRLLVMFSAILKEHDEKQEAQREENERLSKAATASIAKLTDILVDQLNSGVVEAFQVQKEIEAQARELQTEAVRFSQQTEKWANSVQTFDNAVKEIGDFEHWMKTMEWDMQTVATALESVAANQGQHRES
eukprot:42917-Prorocentrum_minimum.AAC.3